jgi:integrase
VSEKQATPRRVREPGDQNRNIYRRADGVFEIGYRDSTGRQRWKVIEGGITAARAARDDVLGRKGRGERVTPSPRLSFGEAAERWLAEQVTDLRPGTRARYESDIRLHVLDRWGRRRLDRISVNDAAQLVHELRGQGLAEWTIQGVLVAAGRVFKFAKRRMHWSGENPIAALENGERPKVSQTARRRIYQGDELAQTLRASREPWRTLFALAAVTGARVSELLALRWSDLDLSDPSEASVTIAAQLDRQGCHQALKTDESERTIELPRQLVSVLLEHRARSLQCGERDLVFATCSGRSLGQRNTLRALRRAQIKARTPEGKPTFPALFEPETAEGRWIPRRAVPRGSVPNFHAFRHTAASEAIAADGSADEISWQLGHKNSVITQTIYRHEIKSVERRAKRRAAMEARYGDLLDGTAHAAPPADRAGGELVGLDRSAR